MADPYEANTVFLLNFEDDNGLGVPLALDRSRSRLTIYSSTIDIQITPQAKRYGAYGLQLSTASSALAYAIPTGMPEFNFGTGDFTLEGNFLIDPSSSSSLNPILGREVYWYSSSDWLVYRESDSVSGKLAFSFNAMKVKILSDAPVSVGVYHSWAIVRIAGVISMFVDGVKQSETYSGAIPVPSDINVIRVGSTYGGYSLKGYIDDVRITVGVGRYSSNYTPTQLEYVASPITLSLVSKPSSIAIAQEPLSCKTTSKVFDSLNWYYGGHGRIASTVKEKGVPADVPVVRRVCLYAKENYQCAAMQWSNANGEYSFEGFDPEKKFFVTAFDHTKNYNAVIADDISPTPHRY